MEKILSSVQPYLNVKTLALTVGVYLLWHVWERYRASRASGGGEHWREVKCHCGWSGTVSKFSPRCRKCGWEFP